jgi:threonine dehydrogenase-like Zn-dependent dehydrogenase
VRAAVLRGGTVTDLIEVSPPNPGPGQVRVRLEGCGVCGSDVPVWEGRSWLEYPREPGAPGHEGWGWIDALGPGVIGIAPETRVACLTYCAYAEQDLAAENQVVPLPPDLDGRAFPGESLACAVNVFRRARIAAAERVAVVGVGFLGAMVAQLATLARATVVGVSRREASLRHARRMGVPETATLESPPDRESFDVVIEAAGRQETLDAAARLVKARGRLVIAGFHQGGPRTIDLQSWNWRGIDVINAHERDPEMYLEGLRLATRWTAEGKLYPDPLYSHRFPLERAGDAFDAAAERPESFMKALVLT